MTSHVAVAVRIRPLSYREKQNRAKSVLDVNGAISTVHVTAPAERMSCKADYCFGSSEETGDGVAKQLEVFNAIGRPAVEMLMVGNSQIIMAYGQSGTGKTYTIMGPPTEEGLVPSILRELFKRFNKQQHTVSLSCFEIAEGKLRDLLSPSAANLNSKGLTVKKHPRLGVQIEHLTSFLCYNENDARKFVEEANQLRKVGINNFNAHSSRSHMIVQIGVRSRADNNFTAASLQLIDLAGSEPGVLEGKGAQSHRSIAKSLQVLQTCVQKLIDNQTNRSLIPFKDTPLTMLLQDSLGSTCRATVITTVTPSDLVVNETVLTLQFAQLLRKVKQSPTVSTDANVELSRQLREEIDGIKVKLKMLDEGKKPPGGGTKAELLQQLVDSTEMFQQVTQTDDEMLAKQKMILAQRQKALGKLLKDDPSVDASLCRLYTLNDNLAATFPEMLSMYYLHNGTTSLGTGAESTIVLKIPQRAYDEDPSVEKVSPLHCQLTTSNLKRELYVLAPPKGHTVHVNGHVVKEKCQLQNMDRLIIGPIVFRVVLPVVWTGNAASEFDRNAKDVSHVQDVEEYDRLHQAVEEYDDLRNTIGEDKVNRVCSQDAEKARSDLATCEDRLVLEHPLDDILGGVLPEKAAQYDYRYAIKEKGLVANGPAQQEKARALNDLLNELTEAEKPASKATTKPAADLDLDEDDPLGILGAAKTSVRQSLPPQRTQSVAPQQHSTPPPPTEATGNKVGTLDDLLALPPNAPTSSKPVVLPSDSDDSEDETSVVAPTGGPSVQQLLDQLGQIMGAYQRELEKARKWKPNGPDIKADLEEYEVAKLGGVPLARVLNASEHNPVEKQGEMYKLRTKKTMFHKGGFMPVHCVLKGRFLYYFESTSSLGAVYLYGAPIFALDEGLEDKDYCLKIEPTVPRKTTKEKRFPTEENNVVLAFNTEPELQEWLLALTRASQPKLPPELSRFFGDQVLLPSCVLQKPDRTLRTPGQLGDDEEIVLPGDDRERIKLFIDSDDATEPSAQKKPPKVAFAAERTRPDPTKEDMYIQTSAEQVFNRRRDADDAYQKERAAHLDEAMKVWKVNAKDLLNHKYLKAYFRCAMEWRHEDKVERRNRMWLVDHFTGTVELLDITNKIARVYNATQLLTLEKSLSDPTLIQMVFFHHGYHRYAEYFVSFAERERFFDTANAVRPTLRVFCPNLVEKGCVDSTTGIDCTTPVEVIGTGPTGNVQKMLLQGVTSLRVSNSMIEPVSVWVGTLNLSGFPLQNPDMLEQWVPRNKYDIYALSLQEASYRTTKTQFFDFLSNYFGVEYLTVLAIDMYDLLLIVVARRRHFVKITNVEGSTCPSTLESMVGERGGVGISLFYMNTSMAFVAVHLPGPSTKHDLRRYLINEILSGLSLGEKSSDLCNQFDHIFLLGDFKCPLEASATMADVEAAIKGNKIEAFSRGTRLADQAARKREAAV